jgi:hypothetical protein
MYYAGRVHDPPFQQILKILKIAWPGWEKKEIQSVDNISITITISLFIHENFMIMNYDYDYEITF